MTAEDLHDLATAAANYGNGELRLTEDQNVIISNVKKEHLEALQNDQILRRFPTKPGKLQLELCPVLAAHIAACHGQHKRPARSLAEELDQELHLPEDHSLDGMPKYLRTSLYGRHWPDR